MRTVYHFRPNQASLVTITDEGGCPVLEGQDFRTSREALAALRARYQGQRVRVNVGYDKRGEPVMATIEDSDRDLEFQVPPETEAVLDNLAERIHGTKAEVFSWALALLKVAVEANEKGQRLIIADRKGKPVSEVTLFPEGGA